MGNLTNENNGTITVTDADGTTVEVVGTFVLTGATVKGEVLLDFTSKTGVTAGVLIAIIGKAGIDGSIALDLTVSDGASFGLVASSAVVMAADPGLTTDVAALAKAVKADAKALRAQRLAIQEEVAAKIDADTTSTNRGVLNRAIQLVADMQDVLDSTLTSSQKITRIGELNTVLAGLSLQVGASVITDLVTALNMTDGTYTETQKLASFSSAVAQATTDIATAKTSAESRDVAAQTKKEKTEQQVRVAKKTVVKGKKTVKKTAATLNKLIKK